MKKLTMILSAKIRCQGKDMCEVKINAKPFVA